MWFVILITFSTRVHGFSRRASVASEKKILGVSRDFGQCTGENRLAVCDYIALPWARIATRGGIALGRGFLPGGALPPRGDVPVGFPQ